MRIEDESYQYCDREDESADDRLRRTLDLRRYEADDRASQQTNTIGTDEADHVNEVAICIEALGQIWRGIGSALIDRVNAEISDACPDNTGVLESLHCLSEAEELRILIDLTLEVGDQEESDDAQYRDDHCQEDQHDLNTGSSIRDGCDDARVDEAEHKAGNTIDRVGDTDLGRVFIFFAAEPDDLEARTPPDEDGGDTHGDEEREANLDRRKCGVDRYQDRCGQEADRCQGTHAELVSYDA